MWKLKIAVMLKNEHDQMDIPSMQKVFALISGITSN